MNLWTDDIRQTGKLTVFNGTTGSWTHAIEVATNLFNAMCKHYKIGVHLKPEKDENTANIVVKLAEGAGQYPYKGETVNLTVPAGVIHGMTHTFAPNDYIEKAVLFLPTNPQTQAGFRKDGEMSYESLSAGARSVVAAHEFVHACGMDSNDDHDKTGGLFYARLEPKGAGLAEWASKKPAMPPLRMEGDSLAYFKQQWEKE